MANNIKGRDSDQRIAALTLAITRAGQDGGIEGSIDVFGLAEQYYSWLTGQTDPHKPLREFGIKERHDE